MGNLDNLPECCRVDTNAGKDWVFLIALLGYLTGLVAVVIGFACFVDGRYQVIVFAMAWLAAEYIAYRLLARWLRRFVIPISTTETYWYLEDGHTIRAALPGELFVGKHDRLLCIRSEMRFDLRRYWHKVHQQYYRWSNVTIKFKTESSKEADRKKASYNAQLISNREAVVAFCNWFANLPTSGESCDDVWRELNRVDLPFSIEYLSQPIVRRMY